jgi:hypothetical protein
MTRSSSFWWIFPITMAMSIGGLCLVIFGRSLGIGYVLAGLILCVFAIPIIIMGSISE